MYEIDPTNEPRRSEREIQRRVSIPLLSFTLSETLLLSSFDLADKTSLERIREFRESEYRFQIFHCRLATTDVPVFKGEPARGIVNRVCMNYRSRPDTEARKRSKESVSTFQFSRSREISDSIVHSTPPFSFRSVRATSFSSSSEGLKR